MKVALYARVSKDEADSEGRFQNPENQLMPMRAYALKMGWEVVEYVEYASGGSNRPVFRKVLELGLKQQHHGILVWSLDRFSREGILDTLLYLQRLKTRGCWVKSLSEEWLDTDNQFSDLMLAQFAWFAQFERKRISERTKAALARRKGLGHPNGRHRNDCMCKKHGGKKTNAPPSQVEVSATAEKHPFSSEKGGVV